MKTISQDHLKSILHYDPVTGIFTSKVSINRWKVGRRCGHLVKPKSNRTAYRAIKIGGISFLEHRLAFLYMTGSMPEFIDHKNLNGTDNSWNNLRVSTRSQNRANTEPYKSNTSGIKGVHWDSSKKRWKVRISFQGKRMYLGRYKTKEEAALAYERKARDLFGEFARTG